MARILLVEDNISMSELLSEVLRTANHEVFTAADGLKARSIAMREQFDLLITDISMPNEEGFGLIRTIRKSHPDVRIMVLSGKGADVLEDAKLLGANIALQKPVSMTTVLQTVTNLLGPETDGAVRDAAQK
jgi:two-component system, NtrC family, response regulator HydG